MAGTIEINGTGGIIEGNLGAADVNVNLDSALYLDGTGDYITVPSDSSLDFGAGVDFSFSMWVKFPSTLASEELHLISRGQAGNATAFTLRHNQTNLFFKFSSGSNSGNYTLLDSKTELCLFVFQNFQTYDIDTIKYSNICEIFVKKLRKYLDKDTLFSLKSRIKEKLSDNKLINNLNQMSPLRYVNWLIHPQ